MSQTISLNDAKVLTYAWQDSTFGSANTTAVKYDASDVQDILNENGCEALRVYFALDDADNVTAVLVGVDSSDDDITTGPIVDLAVACPPGCPTTPLIK